MLIVVTVFYNRESHVAESIDSLLRALPADSKLLIVDDYSSDDTFLKISSYKDEPRLTIHKNEVNMGFTVTMRSVIERYCKGFDYIAVHGSGDECHPDRFKSQLSFLDRNQDYVFCAARCALINMQRETLSIGQKAGDISFNDLSSGPFWTHGSVMFRASAYFSSGGYESLLKYCQDWDLYRRLLLVGKGKVLDDVLYYKVLFSDGATFSPVKKVVQHQYSQLITSGLLDGDARTYSLRTLGGAGIDQLVPLKSANLSRMILKSYMNLVASGEIVLAQKWYSILLKNKDIPYSGFIKVLIVFVGYFMRIPGARRTMRTIKREMRK